MSAAAIMMLMDTPKSTWQRPDTKGGMAIFGLTTPKTIIDKKLKIVFRYIDFNQNLAYTGRIENDQGGVTRLLLHLDEFECSRERFTIIGEELAHY